jgi:nucleotide-binding universal stress UspA family protein
MTVVVEFDNSEASKAALRLAAQEARRRHAPLVAVSAYEPPLIAPAGGYPAATMHTEGEQRPRPSRNYVTPSATSSVTRRIRPTCGCPLGWPDG